MAKGDMPNAMAGIGYQPGFMKSPWQQDLGQAMGAAGFRNPMTQGSGIPGVETLGAQGGGSIGPSNDGLMRMLQGVGGLFGGQMRNPGIRGPMQENPIGQQSMTSSQQAGPSGSQVPNMAQNVNLGPSGGRMRF